MTKNKKSEPLDFVEAEKTVSRFRTHYDGLQPSISAKLTVVTPQEEAMTKQAFADEVNINNIISKYKQTGVLPNSARSALAQFGDFSEVPSYQDALNTVMLAQDVFAELPSAVRNRFSNDPGEMLAFLNNSNNREEAIKMGLIDPSTGRAPAPTEAQEPTSPPAKAPAAPTAESGSGGK